jgi:peptidoglycan-associated lipoprotein
MADKIKKCSVGLTIALTVLTLGCPKKAVKPQIVPPPSIEEEMKEVEKVVPKVEKLQTIYFDFDKADIRADAQEVLKKNAQVLKEQPEVNIVIEGHCCPIGTSEYNMALGWRRANAAMNYLIKLGIAKERITTISYGEERLVTEKPDEYWKNRRCEFIVK